jgi:hypothetical protein
LVKGQIGDSQLDTVQRSASRSYKEKPISQNAQRPLFHLLGLRGGFVETRLKVRPSMFPSHLDGGFHIVGQHYKLRRSAVIVGAKTNDVDLSHSGRKIARKPDESKGSGLIEGS